MLLLPTLLLLQAMPLSTPLSGPLPPARIELTTPFPVHLGSLGPKDIRDVTFGIRSLHDRPLTLRVLVLSPGITLDGAQLREPLKPGEERPLHAKVDSTGMIGFVKGGSVWARTILHSPITSCATT